MDRPVWDQDKEPYEDFLEKLPDFLQQGLAEGTAFMAVPGDGFDLMKRFMESAREENQLAEWLAFIEAIEDENECKQRISDIASLEVVAVSIAKSLAKRKRELHKLTCEKCGADDAPSDSQVKRAIDAARQAFLDTIQGDDPEAWKGDSE
jgi:hypothetical protein